MTSECQKLLTGEKEDYLGVGLCAVATNAGGAELLTFGIIPFLDKYKIQSSLETWVSKTPLALYTEQSLPICIPDTGTRLISLI